MIRGKAHGCSNKVYIAQVNYHAVLLWRPLELHDNLDSAQKIACG